MWLKYKKESWYTHLSYDLFCSVFVFLVDFDLSKVWHDIYVYEKLEREDFELLFLTLYLFILLG